MGRIYEIKFIYQLLLSIGIQVKLPIIVRVDNVRAIFMSKNTSTSGCTKYIDIRYQYVNEMILDGFLKVLFVKTSKNVAYVFTQNVRSETYLVLAKHFLINQKLIRN